MDISWDYKLGLYRLHVIRVLKLIYIIGCFFFNDTATTEIYTLSLHDALPISVVAGNWRSPEPVPGCSARSGSRHRERRDRKSTRLNSSHTVISYAVFCLKKKNCPAFLA